MSGKLIFARVELRPGSLKRLVEQLLSLPADLRPTRHKLGETEKSKPVGDSAAFIQTLKERSPAPWLENDNCSYVLSVAAPKPIVCAAWLDVPPHRAEVLLEELSALDPLFGLAATEEEYEARHRLNVNVGGRAIEGWVGRDVSRYIPGLYWRTLISSSLLEKHGVKAAALEAMANEHREVHGARQHLFRLYDAPEDWLTRPARSTAIRGVFDVHQVNRELAGAKNRVEASALLAKWP